jgi:hypothetical protein
MSFFMHHLPFHFCPLEIRKKQAYALNLGHIVKIVILLYIEKTLWFT